MIEHAAPRRPGRWSPPARLGRTVRCVLLLASVATLLTNAYYLQWAEPAVSRRSLALALFAATALWSALVAWGIPVSRKELRAVAERWATPALLGTILAVAFGLRLWGADFGLPQSYVPDEYDYVHSYLQMIKRGDLNPHWWYHPSLQPYVNVVTYLLVFFVEVPTGRWASVHQMQVEDMLFWGRFGVGVVFGTATVLVAFLLGRRVFGERVGLIAAALLALFPGAVEVSQYNKPDPLLVFMTATTVLVVLAYLIEGGRRLAFFSGLAMGLTVAAKYNGGLVLVPFLLAVALRHRGRLFAEPDLYLGALGSIVGFLAGCPYFLAEIPKSLDQVADGLYTYGFTGREGAEGVDNWATHARYTVSYGAGWMALLAAVGGLALALGRLDARLAVFLAFPVLYYAYYGSQRINFPGNLIPVYPFLAVLAASGVSEAAAAAVRRLRRWTPAPRLRTVAAERFVLAALLVAVGWFPLHMTIRHNRLVTLPDTGNAAREWIEATFPPGTHFAVERHTPVLDPKKFRITMESRVINQSVEHYREAGVDYLVVSSTVYERFGPEHRQTKAYRRLFERCPLVMEFAPVEGRRWGPTIRILRVPDEGE